ncbi:MAG: hypothetical protein AB1744_14280, partial [Candidatus Zixiibacteriota bacterium]
ATPTPTPGTGTITAVAKVVSAGKTACLNIVNSATGLGGTVFTTTPKLSPANRTQSGSSPVQWTNVPANVTYTLGVTPPAGGYTQANICRTKTGGAPYQTGATATLLAGETISWYVGFLGPTPTPTPTPSPTPLVQEAWWQVKDADVLTDGVLVSRVPGTEKFDLAGLGGYPGIPLYGDLTNLTLANVSAKGWLVNSLSPALSSKVYNYAYFARQVPADTVINEVTSISLPGSFFTSGGTPSYGYYWYKFDGTNGLDLTITSDMNLGSRKVILLVDSADLYLNGKVNLTDGVGFFLAIVGANILIDPSVGGAADGIPELEGFFLADNQFRTGLGSNQLHLRGAMAAYGGIALQRDLGAAANPTTPAELFEYAPDQVFLFPPKLSVRKMRWKEVPP